MIYFTADMHFGHRAIITMQNRPFESVEEMNRVLLQNFNAVVQKDDTVYIIGDICHHMKIEDADNLIKKLNGKKYLIRGNHDKNYDPRLFADIQDFMKISVDANNFFPVSAKQIVSFFEEHSTDEFSISCNTLNVMDAAISNLNEGKVSERIEI